MINSQQQTKVETMKTLIALLIATISFNVLAYDFSMVKSFGSIHTIALDRDNLNQVNPAIGIEYNDFQVIHMNENSWKKESLYATYAPDYKVNDYIDVSVQVGLATGYKCGTTLNNIIIGYCSDNGVVPLAAATMNYSPFANKFSFVISANPFVVMLGASYDL